MLAATRQNQILHLVNLKGSIKVIDLAISLDVSDMTVRRDLDLLARRGLLAKVHGGATSLSGSSSTEPTFSTKMLRERAIKDSIAREAVRLVEPGMAIALSGGSTTHALAHYLVDVPGITVVTNSIPAADVLSAAQRDDQTVVLTGGQRTPSDALVGPVAVSTMTNLHVDILFMGVYGFTTESGFTTPNLIEAQTNHAMVLASKRLIVLADHTKWGLTGLSTIAQLHEASRIYSDTQLAQDARGAIANVGCELSLVATSGEEAIA